MDDGKVPVTITGAEGSLRVELYAPSATVKRDPAIARCETPCIAHLERGQYRLLVYATDDTVEGSRMITIDDSRDLIVHPRSSGSGETGLALGILGPVAIIGGGVLALSNMNLCVDSCEPRDTSPGLALLGVGLMLGGLVATPIGWVLYGQSRHPGVEMAPLVLAPPVARLAPMEPRHSAPMGLGFRAVF